MGLLNRGDRGDGRVKHTIRLITNESGDWEVLLLNGEVYEEGHSISNHAWINLIHDLGNEVSIEYVTDEEMEYELY